MFRIPQAEYNSKSSPYFTNKMITSTSSYLPQSSRPPIGISKYQTFSYHEKMNNIHWDENGFRDSPKRSIGLADQDEYDDLLDNSTRPRERPFPLVLPGENDDPADDQSASENEQMEFRSSRQEFSKNTMDKESVESYSSRSEGWKRRARIILPHIGLVILTCAYTLIGAGIIYRIEQPHEQRVKQKSLMRIFEEENRFLRDMFRLARYDRRMSEKNWRRLAHQRFLNMTDLLYDSFNQHFLTAKEIRENRTNEIWSFSTAVLFAATVVTTIGYGDPVPVTFTGRLVCVLFALFGIPLTLLTIANIGKFFSEHLLWLYSCYLRLSQKLNILRSRFGKKSRSKNTRNCKSICEKCRQPSLCDGKCIRRKSSFGDIDLANIQEKTVPASVVLSILIGYTALGGFIFQTMENWDFFEAFYFSFITMTTIGFGDLVPSSCSMVLILLYIVIGLAITTMTIDLVGAHYIRKIHYFGRKIQDARSALAIVGGKVVYVGELYAQLMTKRYGLQKEQLDLVQDAFIVENVFLTKHLIPFVPQDIKRIQYIDQDTETLYSGGTSPEDTCYCRYCHGPVEGNARRCRKTRLYRV